MNSRHFLDVIYKNIAKQLLGSVCVCFTVVNFTGQHYPRLVLMICTLIHTGLKLKTYYLFHKTIKQCRCLCQERSVHFCRRCNLPYQCHLAQCPPRTKRLLQSTDIRLIDFGSANFEQEYHSTVVRPSLQGTRIILGRFPMAGQGFTCTYFLKQVWDGLILVMPTHWAASLWSSYWVCTISNHDNLEHLAMMEAVMGKMPERFARGGCKVET